MFSAVPNVYQEITGQVLTTQTQLFRNEYNFTCKYDDIYRILVCTRITEFVILSHIKNLQVLNRFSVSK